MFCPKCNYTSFDHLQNCPRCNFDWSETKRTFNLDWLAASSISALNLEHVDSGAGDSRHQAEDHKQTVGTHGVSQESSPEQSESEDIFIDDMDMEVVQEGDASLEPEDSSGSDVGQEMDTEISFEGLQDVVFEDTETEEASDTSASTVEEPQAEEDEVVMELDFQEEEVASAQQEEPRGGDELEDVDISPLIEDLEEEEEPGKKDRGDKGSE